MRRRNMLRSRSVVDLVMLGPGLYRAGLYRVRQSAVAEPGWLTQLAECLTEGRTPTLIVVGNSRFASRAADQLGHLIDQAVELAPAGLAPSRLWNDAVSIVAEADDASATTGDLRILLRSLHCQAWQAVDLEQAGELNVAATVNIRDLFEQIRTAADHCVND